MKMLLSSQTVTPAENMMPKMISNPVFVGMRLFASGSAGIGGAYCFHSFPPTIQNRAMPPKTAVMTRESMRFFRLYSPVYVQISNVWHVIAVKLYRSFLICIPPLGIGIR